MANGEAMTDVFISYSRKDRKFKEWLRDQLDLKGIKTWVDTNDIHGGERWGPAIQRAIEQAHTCLFIISPDFAASEWCNREVEYATEHHKKIVPVLHQRLNASQKLLPSLHERHRIDFSSDSNLDKSIEKLFETIQEDIDWNRTHRKILVRARAWDNGDKDDNSYALRGNELEAALEWLTRSESHQEKPTQLQIDYIRSSQRWQGQEVERYQNLYDNAEQQRNAAENRLSDAVTTAHRLIDAVENKLVPIAGTGKVRHELLQTASSLLKRLQEGANENAESLSLFINSQNEQGRLAATHGNVSLAVDAYEASTMTAKAAAADNLDDIDMQSAMASGYRGLGQAASNAGDYKKADQALQDALKFNRSMTEKMPDNAEFSYELSMTYQQLGELSHIEEQYDQAHRTYEELVALSAKLTKTYPENVKYLQAYADALAGFADVAVTDGQTEAAKDAMQQCRQILETLDKQNIGDQQLQIALARTYAKYADLERMTGSLENSRHYYTKSLSVLSDLQLADTENKEYQYAAAVVHHGLGKLFTEMEEIAEARQELDETRALLESLIEADPLHVYYRWNLAAVYDDLGQAALALGHYREAISMLDLSLEQKQKLVDQDPENGRWQRDLVKTYLMLLSIDNTDDNFRDGIFRNVLPIYEHLRDTRHNNHPIVLKMGAVIDMWRKERPYRRVLLQEALQLKHLMISVDFLLPQHYVTRAMDLWEDGIADPMKGFLWGREDDVATVIETDDFSKINEGIFHARLSDEVGYLEDTGTFSNETYLPDEMKRRGFENIKIRKHELYVYPALEIVADLDNKCIRMLYLSILQDSMTVLINYRHPYPQTERDDNTWNHFLESFSLAQNRSWGRGQRAKELLSLVLARLSLIPSYTARLSLHTTAGPDDAQARPIIRQKCLMKVRDRRLIKIKNDFSSQSDLHYTEGAEQYSWISNSDGVFEAGDVQIRMSDSSPVYYESEKTGKIKVTNPETEPVFNGLLIFAGFPLLCNGNLQQLLAAQFSYYDLRIVEERHGLIVLKGEIQREKAIKQLQRGVFNETQAAITSRRISTLKVVVRHDGQWVLSESEGLYNQFPMRTKFQSVGFEIEKDIWDVDLQDPFLIGGKQSTSKWKRYFRPLFAGQ